MIFRLFLWLSCISPLRTPLSQQSCQIKITSLKIQSTLPLQTARASLLAIHVFRCTLYHGGDAFGAWGSPTWQFHQNLMYSFIVTSKLCLFADNRGCLPGAGRTGKQTGTCRSVSYRTSGGPAPAGHVTPAGSPVEQEPVEYTTSLPRFSTVFLRPPLSLFVYRDVCMCFCVQSCDKHRMCSA